MASLSNLAKWLEMSSRTLPFSATARQLLREQHPALTESVWGLWNLLSPLVLLSNMDVAYFLLKSYDCFGCLTCCAFSLCYCHDCFRTLVLLPCWWHLLQKLMYGTNMHIVPHCYKTFHFSSTTVTPSWIWYFQLQLVVWTTRSFFLAGELWPKHWPWICCWTISILSLESKDIQGMSSMDWLQLTKIIFLLVQNK